MDHCSLVVGEMAVAQLGVSAVRPASLRSPDARLAGAKALRPNFPTRRRRGGVGGGHVEGCGRHRLGVAAQVAASS